MEILLRAVPQGMEQHVVGERRLCSSYIVSKKLSDSGVTGLTVIRHSSQHQLPQAVSSYLGTLVPLNMDQILLQENFSPSFLLDHHPTLG